MSCCFRHARNKPLSCGYKSPRNPRLCAAFLLIIVEACQSLGETMLTSAGTLLVRWLVLSRKKNGCTLFAPRELPTDQCFELVLSLDAASHCQDIMMIGFIQSIFDSP